MLIVWRGVLDENPKICSCFHHSRFFCVLYFSPPKLQWGSKFRIARAFAPDLVLVSAGFDAAPGDPLGGCRVSPSGFYQITKQLMGASKWSHFCGEKTRKLLVLRSWLLVSSQKQVRKQPHILTCSTSKNSVG